MKAMAQMIVDQGFFGVANRLLNRMQLLRQFQAGTAIGEHFDDVLKVAFGTQQAPGDLGVGFRHVVAGVGWETDTDFEPISATDVIDDQPGAARTIFGRSTLEIAAATAAPSLQWAP